MADYVVRLNGQDNLSGTIKQVKSELNDLGKTTSKLDQIDKKFEKITQSTVGVKRELRDLKNLGSQIKFDGDYNAAQLLKIAKAAGEAKDSMDDFSDLTRYFADDSRHLNTAVQGMQGLAAAGSVAAGVLGIVGVESEKVNQAILWCQSSLSILNGLQTVANVLNKDSYVRIALKVLGLKAEAAATNKATAAQAANTAATKVGTLAQLKLNAAVLANPYVLAAAAVAALAAGIIYWVSTMDDATEAEEGVAEAIKVANDATTKGYEAYMKNRMELDQLKTTLDNFNGSKEEERALVDDLNNKYGNTLGKYKDLASWKKALANVSEYQCKLMAAEAKLAALNAEAYSAWAKAMSGENFEENMAKFKKLKEFADDALDDVNFYKKQVSIAINLSGGTRGSGSGSSGSGRSTRTTKTGRGGSGSSTEEKEATGLIGKLEKEIKDLQQKVNEATTEDLIKNLNDQLKNKQKELHELKVRVGLEDNPVEELEKEVQEALDKSDAKVEIPVSSFDLAMSKAKGERTDPLDQIKAQMDANDDQIASLKAYEEELRKKGATETEVYNQLIDKIHELEEAQRGLGSTVGGIINLQDQKEQKDKEEAQNLETKKQLYNDLMSTAQSLGSIFKSTGEEGAAAAIEVAMATTNAIKEIIPQVLSLIGVKQGEALAEGTASAAGLPFPANLGAIASIVASIMAVFATIASVAGSFANGGIVGGGTYYGDHILARVNAGEMILNRKQQSNLFRAIESGGIGAGQTVLVPEFKIKGSDLYGTLRNFSKSVGKTGKVTGIR